MTPEAYLLSAVGALSAVVIALWRNDVINHKRDRDEWKVQIADLIGRIRLLEDARVDAAIKHGHEMKAIAERLAKELSENTAILRGVRDAFTRFSEALIARPCMHDYQPQALSAKAETDSVTAKDMHHA
jgi:hypothetical protein